MSGIGQRYLPDNADVLAPDGSEVRILVATGRGSMAHFRLQPGQVAKAIRHRTVDELWFVTAGCGRIWRKDQAGETVTGLVPGLSLTNPAGTSFQFRCDGDEALDIVGVTMPPWPGEDEAEFVQAPW